MVKNLFKILKSKNNDWNSASVVSAGNGERKSKYPCWSSFRDILWCFRRQGVPQYASNCRSWYGCSYSELYNHPVIQLLVKDFKVMETLGAGGNIYIRRLFCNDQLLTFINPIWTTFRFLYQACFFISEASLMHNNTPGHEALFLCCQQQPDVEFPLLTVRFFTLQVSQEREVFSRVQPSSFDQPWISSRGSYRKRVFLSRKVPTLHSSIRPSMLTLW